MLLSSARFARSGLVVAAALVAAAGCSSSDRPADDRAAAVAEAHSATAESAPTATGTVQPPATAEADQEAPQQVPLPLPPAPAGSQAPVRLAALSAGEGPPSGEGIVPRKNPLRGGAADAGEGFSLRAKEATPADPAKKIGKGKHSGVPFDPIKENGEFFAGWSKPKLALVITGRQDGYLEPCGCAGLDRMKGGLMRRHSFFEELRRKRGWPLVAVDVGGLVKGFGRQTELKFQTAVSAMQKMGYDAIGLGKNELRLPTGELVSVAAGVEGKPSPFISANVGLFGFSSGLTGRKRVMEAGGMKIGITSVLGKKYQKEIINPDVEMTDPEAELQKLLPELKKDHCDLLVLLAHATADESVELARRFPEFEVVVTAGGPAEPPSLAPQKAGERTLLIEVGEKGMAAVVLGFYDDPNRRVRYQRVLLDSRYPSSPDIKALFAAYQGQLKELGLAGLNVRAVPHARREELGAYVGSEKCESCHETSYRIWKKSGHAKAYDTLVKADPPRNFDPECISCHVIGWHPTEYFPYQGGFLSTEKTPQLINVGCESCHGPGGAHCEAEMKNDPALQEKLRKAAVITKAESEKHQCMTCHDLDNSPDFEFKLYWPNVEHYE